MAKREHLEMIKRTISEQDISIWNNWRAKDPESWVDLTEIDLSGANLSLPNLVNPFSGTDLLLFLLQQSEDLLHIPVLEGPSPNIGVGVNLSKTYLHHSNLNGACLAGANMQFANIENATLRETNLTYARLDNVMGYRPDMRKANLAGASLSGFFVDEPYLQEAMLRGARLSSAALERADLRSANLQFSDLTNASLVEADLRCANMIKANLQGANLSKANLSGASLVGTNLKDATLSGAKIFGVSVWGTEGEPKDQTGLIITPSKQPKVEVDDLEAAQFVYLLLSNEKIRKVIETIGKKGVLILGRFSQRKYILDAIRRKLRDLGYVPMVFDFERPAQRDFTETIKILAGLSRFIVADITSPRSIPMEIHAIVPDYMIPFVPIIQAGEEPFAMFRDLQRKYGDWVLDVLEYDSVNILVKNFEEAVIGPALERSHRLSKKTDAVRMRRVSDGE